MKYLYENRFKVLTYKQLEYKTQTNTFCLNLTNPTNLTKFYNIDVIGMNEIVPKQYFAIVQSNPAVVPPYHPLSSNSSSSLFYQTPLINQLSHPTNSNSSTSSDSSISYHNGMSSYHYQSMYDKGHPNAMGSGEHNGDHCTYSDFKSNVCAS